MWAITKSQLLCRVGGKEIFDISNNFCQFCISNVVVEREKPTHTKIRAIKFNNALLLFD